MAPRARKDYCLAAERFLTAPAAQHRATRGTATTPGWLIAHLLDRFALFYPMRIVGAYFLIVVASLYAWQFNGFNAFYFLLVAVLAVHPHVVQHIARKYPQSRLEIETRAFLVDAFL